MSTIGKCSVCGKKGPLGIDERCNSCLYDQDDEVPYCDSCMEDLSEDEIDKCETTCYNCQKGKED